MIWDQSVGFKVLRDLPYKFILFCDDLSFSYDDQNYKSLKAILDGGLGAGGKCYILCYF